MNNFRGSQVRSMQLDKRRSCALLPVLAVHGNNVSFGSNVVANTYLAGQAFG